MHEYSLAQKVIEMTLDIASGRKVLEVNLIIGDFSSVSPESLLFYLETLAKDTIIEEAKINIERINAEFFCNICGKTYIPNEELICPYCQGSEGKFLKGREFYLESIEVED